MLAYRFLTEEDTSAFCHKVTLALAGAGLLVHDENCVGAGSPANFDGAYFRRRS